MNLEKIGEIIRSVGGVICAIGIIYIFTIMFDMAEGDLVNAVLYLWRYLIMFFPASIVCFFTTSDIMAGPEPTCETMMIIWVGLALNVLGWFLMSVGRRINDRKRKNP
jgi:hypothetical protein